MTSRKEIRTRSEEGAIFADRVQQIKALLLHPSLKPALSSALSFSSTALDLFTGTGAGMQALCEALTVLGKPPREIVGVDHYFDGRMIRNYTPEVVAFMRDARYAWTIDETRRNVEALGKRTSVRVVEAEAWDFMNSPEEQQVFGITTGFATAVSDLDIPKLVTALANRRFVEGYQMPFLLTFGQSRWHELPDYRRLIAARGLGWNFYQKPRDLKSPEWDTVILTDVQLELDRA